MTYVDRQTFEMMSSLAERIARDSDVEDAAQVALIGVWMAWKTWDKERGGFELWAYWHASTELRRALRPVQWDVIGDIPSTECFDEAVDIERWASTVLDGRETEIIGRRFRGDTLREIGEAIGVSPERVRVLEHRILGKLYGKYGGQAVMFEREMCRDESREWRARRARSLRTREAARADGHLRIGVSRIHADPSPEQLTASAPEPGTDGV